MCSISQFPLLSVCAPNQEVDKSFLANKPSRCSLKKHYFSSTENADFSCLLQSFHTFRIYLHHITQGLLELATASELLLFMETLNEMGPSASFAPEIFLRSSVCVWIYTSHKQLFGTSAHI